MLEQSLIKLGLTAGEAKVYLALQQIGESSVGTIVKKSKVASSKIYNILDRLLEKGLASYIIQEKTKYFTAVRPARLNEFIGKKEKELQVQRINLQKIIPALEQLPNTNGVLHDASVFIGFAGIKTAYEELLASASPNETIKFFFVHDKKYDEHVYKFYFQTNFFGMLRHFHVTKKIGWSGIANKEQTVRLTTPKQPSFFKLQYTTQALPGNIDITTNHILITAWSEKPVGILIRSSEIANNLHNYFLKVQSNIKK